MGKVSKIKGLITSIVGVAAMILSLVSIWYDKIDFVWDGIAGLCIGTVLLLAPKTIEKNFIAIISKFTTKSKPVGSSPEVPEDLKSE